MISKITPLQKIDLRARICGKSVKVNSLLSEQEAERRHAKFLEFLSQFPQQISTMKLTNVKPLGRFGIDRDPGFGLWCVTFLPLDWKNRSRDIFPLFFSSVRCFIVLVFLFFISSFFPFSWFSCSLCPSVVGKRFTLRLPSLVRFVLREKIITAITGSHFLWSTPS